MLWSKLKKPQLLWAIFEYKVTVVEQYAIVLYLEHIKEKHSSVWWHLIEYFPGLVFVMEELEETTIALGYMTVLEQHAMVLY